jgi:NitT/TauT family transport system ATP-binding protein
LLPWRTAADNVYLPLLLAGVGKGEARERVSEALAQVGLFAFADRYPRQLSGGMKMRVSIARALVTRPDILLMDEPFAALDEITRGKLNDELLDLYARRKLTVIFVTHSVYESVYLSSRIVVMSARPGRVVTDIAVDSGHPRTEEYRTSSLYNERCRAASAALRLAMTSGEPTQ